MTVYLVGLVPVFSKTYISKIANTLYNSHQEIETKCEHHDCISVKMLFKLNGQINFQKYFVASDEAYVHIQTHSGKLKVANGRKQTIENFV